VAPAAGAHVACAPAAGVSASGGAHVASAPPAAGSVSHGPAPSALGIAPQNVAHVPPGDRGTAMAKNFSRPSTATKMGAHPPAHRQMAKPATHQKPTYRGAPRSGGGFHGGGRR
jgi:hypothetical protein